MMNQTELTIVVLGLLALVGMGVVAYVTRVLKGGLAEIAEVFQPVLERLVEHADAALAPYGPQLKPAHELVTALGPLVDEPGDFIIKALAKAVGAKPEDVVAALQPVVQGAAELTDGEPANPDLPPDYRAVLEDQQPEAESPAQPAGLYPPGQDAPSPETG